MKKEGLVKFYSDYKFYIFPIIVALSSLILIIFVIFPQLISLIANQKAEKNILNKAKLLEVKAQTLESYDLTDLNQKVDYAIGAYPTEKDAIEAIGALQKLISQFGFNIVAISAGSGVGKNTAAQSYSFKIEILGPGFLVPSLLSGLENSPRLMRVSGVEVNSTTAGENISLDVDLLYAVAPTSFGSVDSPLPILSEQDEQVLAKLARMGVVSRSTQVSNQLGPRGKINPFE